MRLYSTNRIIIGDSLLAMIKPLSLLFTCIITLCGVALPAPSKTIGSEANVPVEILLTSEKQHDDAFNNVQVDVLFTDASGQNKLVPAFWAGGRNWKVRYASGSVGKHKWQSQCNVPDSGLSGATGTVKITPYRGSNPLFKRGPIEIAADKRHFQYADRTPFFWLGDTWWMGLCQRLQWPKDFKHLAADRKEKGFNVIQIVAGLYPDMHPFDPRGANEAGFPWETNYARIRPEYFNAADERLRYLVDEGFVPCIVGAWGYFLPWMGEQRAKQHWRELIARYGAWPVVWVVAGEANLPWYLAKGFPYDDRELVKGWTEVARYIRAADPFRRPLTIHPTGIGKLNARWAIDDASLIDFDMLQTPHGQREAVLPTVSAFNYAYNLLPSMPVLNGEAAYEMLNGQITAQWARAMFWVCLINGAAGHTYGANGIWQVNRRDQPHGASPHGGNYGTIPWDEAMNLPGSRQLAEAKKFLENFPWYRCMPQPETVSWADAPSTKKWGHWIWYPEGDPKLDAPVETRYFRRTFDAGRNIKRAILRIAVDDQAVIWLNEKKLGEVTNWQTPQTFDLQGSLREKGNILAIEARNLPAPVSQNPAGLMAVLEIDSDKGPQFLISDGEWKAAKKAEAGWLTGSDQSDWKSTRISAAYGLGPWGRIGETDPGFQPYALGIEPNLRIVYALAARPLLIQRLRTESVYRVTRFDPATGQVEAGGMITTDKNGQCRIEAPNHDHDWVIVLEK